MNRNPRCCECMGVIPPPGALFRLCAHHALELLNAIEPEKVPCVSAPSPVSSAPTQALPATSARGASSTPTTAPARPAEVTEPTSPPAPTCTSRVSQATTTATSDLYDNPELLADLAGPGDDDCTEPIQEPAPDPEPAAVVELQLAPPAATVRPELAHLGDRDRVYAEELIADGEDPAEAGRRAVCAGNPRLAADRSYRRLAPHRGQPRGTFLEQAQRRRCSTLEVPGGG